MIFTTGDIGKILRSWRESENLTQQNVADIIGSSQSVVSFSETGTFLEAQNRMARLYFFQLEEFEAGELREIQDSVSLAKALYDARKWLMLSKEIIGARCGLGVGAVMAGESQAFARGFSAYVSHAIREMSSSNKAMEIVSRATMPWFWALPAGTSRPWHSTKRDSFPSDPREAAAEFKRRRKEDFDE